MKGLKIYANILKVPIKVVENQQDMSFALQEFKKKQLILIDTQGVSPSQSDDLKAIIGMLPNDKVVEKLLVIPANIQIESLEKSMEILQEIGITGSVLTKIDEAINVGGALSVAITMQLPIFYVSTGVKIPDDIQAFSANAIIDKVLSSVVNKEKDESTIARFFSDIKVREF